VEKFKLQVILPKVTFDRGIAAHVLTTLRSIFGRIEQWLDTEKDQLPLWIPAGLAMGIVAWEWLGDAGAIAVIAAVILLLLIGFTLAQSTRLSIIFKCAGFTVALGFALIMLKSSYFGMAPIDGLRISEFYGRVISIETIAARDVVRLKLETDGHNGLPAVFRVNMTPEQYKPEFTDGSILRLRARLVPPAAPSLPGGYDFARRAWFSGIGATGTVLGDAKLYAPATQQPFLVSVRRNLSDHIKDALPERSGTIAAALATGDQTAISSEDAEAMRNSGMAHLLSISGLHVTAVVAAIFFLVSKTAALSPYVALRFPVPILAALMAAIGAIGYTLLTGSEVPTIRSCVAAILVLIALILGRDAISLRLIAFGATIVLVFWPEALAGPSFQLSFAAVATIIAIHDNPSIRKLSRNEEDGWIKARLRNILMLLITGVAIELVLAPIALFHFHKTGLYGALANIIAIPLTTFVTMPAEALALLFDLIGLGAPFWWVTGKSIDIILIMADYINALPGAVSMLPNMPIWAFGAMVMGALWLGLFQSRQRLFGLIPFAIGFFAMITAPTPDILVTGDGKHVAVLNNAGQIALLRDRAGEYVRNTLSEAAGISAAPIAIDEWPGSDCTPDSCVIQIGSGSERVTMLALRSRYRIPAMELAAACKRVDIVVSERWLPRSCVPLWLKLDRNMLSKTGGIAIHLNGRKLQTVSEQSKHAPWVKVAVEANNKREAEFKLKRQLEKKDSL
jgi:competence protein ComEC